MRFRSLSTHMLVVVLFGIFGLQGNGLQGNGLQGNGLQGNGLQGSAIGADLERPRTVPKFELDIQPILTATGCNMGACHGKARGQNGFALSLLGFDSDFDYHAIVREARGRRLAMPAPEASLLLQKATGQVPHGGGVRLQPDSEAYAAIVDWIRAGAPRVTADDPVLDEIVISPEPGPLAPESQTQLQVTAIYSDGSRRDVTKICAFQSNEPAIVSVDANGLLKSGKLTGEASIMARFMGRIATWNTAIPRSPEVAPDAYAKLPVKNRLDELVWKKLQALNVLPSEGIDDAKFIRRVSLDLVGRLPTAEEVRSFLDDPAENKREQLVDRLLERPEYADFWANKWADLLRPNPYRVGIKATISLDVWLRDAFRKNLPYDEFVRGLLTAKGSTWHNGAVTVFRDRRTPEEITTMFSQLFLGVRLDCARCHQHPFEVYGQQEFFSLAAYFARVGYKGTGLSPPISGGEEMVYVSTRGEVKHPLTGAALAPQPLWGTAPTVEPEDDPRQVFADWLTSADNRQFAQAGANRIWGELFGKGIVDPVDDLRATNPPSNPELLEALGDEFTRLKFDHKAFLKLLTTSSVYALSSLPNETNDNDHRNFSRHYRRLTRAEVLADSISDITGIPDQFAGMPDQSRAMQLWTHRTGSDFLDAFGRPDPNQDPPCERLPEATMVQTLHLMNAPKIQEKLVSDQGWVAKLAASETPSGGVLDEIYLRVYSRFPTPDERVALNPLFAEEGSTRRQVIEDIVWSLFNTPEFIYED